MTDNKSQEHASKYCCKVCLYNTQRKNDYDKHLSTVKHIKLTNTAKNEEQRINGVLVKKYECKCGKKYLQRQSLFTHKK